MLFDASRATTRSMPVRVHQLGPARRIAARRRRAAGRRVPGRSPSSARRPAPPRRPAARDRSAPGGTGGQPPVPPPCADGRDRACHQRERSDPEEQRSEDPHMLPEQGGLDPRHATAPPACASRAAPRPSAEEARPAGRTARTTRRTSCSHPHRRSCSLQAVEDRQQAAHPGTPCRSRGERPAGHAGDLLQQLGLTSISTGSYVVRANRSVPVG